MMCDWIKGENKFSRTIIIMIQVFKMKKKNAFATWKTMKMTEPQL